ncbi:isochorismate synthase [Actinosynnema sp. NPDC050436]|uniref:isochorismate synthase n=1 Tax=Actinosynnema sp. NPDC050436 TaxID=3155659 RepID=UPI00340BC8E4
MSIDALEREFFTSGIDNIDHSEFVLVGPNQTLAASGVIGQVDARDGEPLRVVAERTGDLLAGASRAVSAREHARGAPLLIGAVPFGDSAPARLVAVRDVRRVPTAPREQVAAPPLRADVRRVDLVPWPARYLDSVRRALAEMDAGRLDKVVLARAIDLIADEPVRTSEIVHSLAAGDPDSYVFATRLGARTPDGGGDRVLVGASPELVIRKFGRSVVSNPLAGSAARSADPDEDRRRARELSTSEKDLREHRIVVDAIADALRPFCSALTVSRRPSVIATPTMWHLSSQVRGVLTTPVPNALQLAAALHPTPAVCGWPTAEAHRFITRSEGFNRRYYGGLIGWMNPEGDGEWVLALRCAEIADNRLRLYAGAGVVPGSDPSAELAETSAKFQRFMSALGLDHALVEQAAQGAVAAASGASGARP